MGADTFMVVKSGPTAQAAFNAAREEAQYERGHGGYTGTIAEKHSFVMIAGKVDDLAGAKALAGKLIDDGDPRIDDKWGPAGCIDMGPSSGARTFLFFGWASS